MAVALATVVAAVAADGDADRRVSAELLGRAMFEAESARVMDKSLIAEAAKQVNDWCKFEYKAIIVPDASGPYVFFAAQPPVSGDLILGRHFLVHGTTVEASTKACLAVPKPEPDKTPVASVTTHLLSKTPTAFHVYLSLKTGQPMYVWIDREMWKIEDGKITWAGSR